jgi:hypothetical protein
MEMLQVPVRVVQERIHQILVDRADNLEMRAAHTLAQV